MKSKNIFVTVVIILSLVIIWLVLNKDDQNNPLLSPILGKIRTQVVNSPLPSPNSPKTFKFDQSTDLKKELETIDPKVLDSDLEDL